MRFMHISRMNRVSYLGVIAAVALGGCTVTEQSAPSVAGPSGPGLSVTLSASPAAIPRDGSSQSTVTVVARDASGSPLPGIRMAANVSPGATGVAQSEAVTGADGRATFLLTAPTLSTVAANNQIVFWVTPLSGINGDFWNATARPVALGLLGPSNTTYPNPNFTFTPEAPTAPAVVVFDGSSTTDEGVQCSSCSYSWRTSDGQSSSGVYAYFEFLSAGTYAVSLTVTDSTGTTSGITKTIEVEAPEPVEDPMAMP
jgi:PKD repeat protein